MYRGGCIDPILWFRGWNQMFLRLFSQKNYVFWIKRIFPHCRSTQDFCPGQILIFWILWLFPELIRDAQLFNLFIWNILVPSCTVAGWSGGLAWWQVPGDHGGSQGTTTDKEPRDELHCWGRIDQFSGVLARMWEAGGRGPYFRVQGSRNKTKPIPHWAHINWPFFIITLIVLP